jgi:putative transposase
MSLKKEFNSLKKEHFPFTCEVTKYASQQPFLQLQKAFQGFFKKKNGYSKFEKKGKAKDSFYIGGNQIKMLVKIPKLGTVRLRGNLRFDGKILNTTVSRIADKWFISFRVEASLSYLPYNRFGYKKPKTSKDKFEKTQKS